MEPEQQQNIGVGSYEAQSEEEKNESSLQDMEGVVIELGIGENRHEKLELRDFEHPQKEIYNFCVAHKLDYEFMEEITMNIEQLIKSKKGVNSIHNENVREDTSSHEANKVREEKVLYTYQNQENPNKILKNNQSNEITNNSGLFPYQFQNYTFDSNHSKVPKNTKCSNSSKKTPASKPLSVKGGNSGNKSIIKKTKTARQPEENSDRIPPVQRQPKLSEIKIVSNNIDVNSLMKGEILKGNNNKYYLGPPQEEKPIVRKKKGKTPEKNIFYRGIEAQKKTLQKLDSIRDSMNQSDEEIYTFNPKINKVNKITRNAEKNRKLFKKEYNNDERILHYKKYVEDKLDKLKNEQKHYGQTKDDIENSTFRPKIKLTNRTKHKKENTFEKLYQTAFTKKSNLEALRKTIQDDCSFKPKINQRPQKVTQNFNERLQSNEEARRRNMAELKIKISEEEKEQNTFKPKLYKNPKYENKPGTSKEKLCSPTQPSKPEKPEIENFVCKASNLIVEEKKKRAFKKLFDLLDSDGDNLITSISINIKNIPETVQEILKPIFNELRQENETLNCYEFITVCEQLYETLPLIKKQQFVNFEKSKKKNVDYVYDFTFKPVIDKNSERIVTDYRIIQTMSNESRSSKISELNTHWGTLKKESIL